MSNIEINRKNIADMLLGLYEKRTLLYEYKC